MKAHRNFKMPFSRQSSKSSIGSSLGGDFGETSEPYGGFNYEETPDTDNMASLHKQFTLAHPLGNLLVRLVTTNTELCKKNNLTIPDVPDLPELCSKFHEAIELERKNVSNEVAKASVDVEGNILNKELNFDSLNAPIRPPVKFSSVPVITTASKMAEVLKSFPTKSNQRFSGKGGSVLEFLNSMNTGQQITNLSKPEFLQVMLKCVSGRVYSMISECIGHNHEIPDVYYSLITLYDNRMTSTKARQILMTYRVPKADNLTKAQSYILELASRVASQLPEGKSRTSMFNIEANNALIRCLPHYASTIATNVLNTLASKLTRNPSFLELTKALTKYRDSINLDITNNGDENRSKNRSRSYREDRNDRKLYAVNTSPNKRYPNSSNNQNNRQGRNNNRYNNRYNNRPGYRHNRPQTQGRYRKNSVNSVNSQNNRSESQPKDRAYNMNQNGGFRGKKGGNSKYCSLCAGTNHNSSDICYKMRDSTGRIVETVPTYNHCETCLQVMGKKVYHPASLCFNRDKSKDNKV